MSSRTTAIKAVALFGVLWGCIGYVLGTATLIGPVRWVTDSLRARSAGESTERMAVIAIIVALVLVSGFVAAACTRMVLRGKTPLTRLGVPATALGLALLCIWVWMTPSLMQGNATEVTVSSVERPAHAEPGTAGSSSAQEPFDVRTPHAGTLGVQTATPSSTDPAGPAAGSGPGSEPGQRPGPASASNRTHFTFGPYPDEARLAELKADGVDAVIALLHPAVVPFEPTLLAREEQAAKVVGIRLLHMPMLPWVGDNSESLEGLRKLASKPGRYYVHCYLGRDRVRLAQAVVSRALDGRGAVDSTEVLQALQTLSDTPAFERGTIVRLSDNAYLTPYPTDEEFASLIVPADWASIVTLLDPEVPANRGWIEKERAILERYGLELIELPISVNRYDAAAVLETVEAIRRLPRPLLVHDFLAVSSGKSPAAEAFLAGWNTGLPSVPASLFDAQELTANLVVGPRPEFSHMGQRGISRVLFVGTGEQAEDRAAAEAAGLRFSAVDPKLQPDWTQRLTEDGPWYVYGFQLGALGL